VTPKGERVDPEPSRPDGKGFSAGWNGHLATLPPLRLRDDIETVLLREMQELQSRSGLGRQLLQRRFLVLLDFVARLVDESAVFHPR
jgi:hypothetical protein